MQMKKSMNIGQIFGGNFIKILPNHIDRVEEGTFPTRVGMNRS